MHMRPSPRGYGDSLKHCNPLKSEPPLGKSTNHCKQFRAHPPTLALPRSAAVAPCKQGKGILPICASQIHDREVLIARSKLVLPKGRRGRRDPSVRPPQGDPVHMRPSPRGYGDSLEHCSPLKSGTPSENRPIVAKKKCKPTNCKT